MSFALTEPEAGSDSAALRTRAARDGDACVINGRKRFITNASCAKLFCTEMVGRVADRGVQVHGGSGYINDCPVERFYRAARLLRLYEGTTKIQQLIIGRALVGRE